MGDVICKVQVEVYVKDNFKLSNKIIVLNCIAMLLARVLTAKGRKSGATAPYEIGAGYTSKIYYLNEVN